MSHYLALDAGTTSCRAIVFTAEGVPVASSQREFEQFFPESGWVEHDADEIATVQQAVMNEAWAAAGQPDILGVGITNQRETVVVFDKNTGTPVHRAIVWQDRRTTEALRAMKEQGHEDKVRAATGLPLDPYFSAAKAAWILDKVPGARERAAKGEVCVATIDAWLLWRLTGGRVFATEPSNASRTSLFDTGTGDWSEELCELFRVPRAALPEVRDSAGVFGFVVDKEWPITGVLGDQQAALFGHGCLAVGQAKCTYGTGAFVLVNAGSRRPEPAEGLLGTVAWRLQGVDTYALEGSVMVAGAAVQWLRDGLGIIADAASVEELARSVPDSGGVVLVPAFAGLGTPHWDPEARGLLVGITRGTTRAHLARATLEAIALQVGEVLEAMERAGGAAPAALRVDGGAAANGLLLELQAWLSGIPVERPRFLERTAFGAFRAALLGAAPERGVAGLPVDPEAPVRIEPAAPDEERQALWRRWREAVRRSAGWVRAVH